MARFVLPIWQLGNDSFSGPGAGWKLNFYSSGGLVRKDTFSDDLLTTANANPVVADSAGRFGAIFMEAGAYRVILTDENDVQKWDQDPVEGAVGLSGAVITKTANYTATTSDLTKIIAGDATAGAITITLLPAATAGDGAELIIKKIDASANAVTVDGNAAETIDGATTVVLALQESSVTLRCDGTNWVIYAMTQEVVNGFALHGNLTPAQITADQNDYNPTGLAKASILRLDSDASRTITGLAGGADGRVLLVHNIGTSNIVLSKEDALSTAANRFVFASILKPGSALALNYDPVSSRWRMSAQSDNTDIQDFAATGTWVKPAFGTYALVEVWGGGGSGGSHVTVTEEAGGGGGGAYRSRLFPLSALGATETVTIGAGGAGVSGTSDGNVGGNTTFGAHLTGFGGGAGSNGTAGAGGGGGGGPFGAGGNAAVGVAGAAGSPGVPWVTQGGDDITDVVLFGQAAGGGGGGAGSGTASRLDGGHGAMGGGGGAGTQNSVTGTGGQSLHAGDGAIGIGNGTGADGGFPSGGGGGHTGTGTGGNGGAGFCRVTVS